MKYFTITATFTILLGINPAIAQNTSSEPYQEYSDGMQYLDFRSGDSLCDGQVLNDGLVCVTDLPEERQPENRLASLLISSPDLRTSTHVQVFELDPNEANIAYLVFIHDIILVAGRSSRVPRLLAMVRSDGSVSVDSDYGLYPAERSAEEESLNVLRRYDREIRSLISSLVQTQ